MSSFLGQDGSDWLPEHKAGVVIGVMIRDKPATSGSRKKA
jgi:hypothetical protein